MSTTINRATGEKSYFEQQREILLGEIAVSFEHVLSSINKLNRSLEGVIAVGNEFSSVEALWSQFENVMAKDGTSEEGGAGTQEGEGIVKREEGEGDGEGEETSMEDGGRV
ncbi:hypothetical protein MFRU_006g00860 [Monilinia fructicola]|uniref:DASH complex subunit DAD1 n=1 Tax=Monilinia fructicola TaxID=38448 RepID=A0A5M9J8I6_MONFR|nr:hypothetical protein EYC84_009360 [Monilinia fructicola]KAG4032616.1 hypothetical protein MFRU_006g00860 [Monilinia fructicola]